jgi:hypothetical protein
VVATRQTLGYLLPLLLAVQTSPWRFTGQTFLCLSLATCDSGTYADRHHRTLDLFSSTTLASLANFALLEVTLTSLDGAHVDRVGHTLDVVLPLNVLQGSSSASLLMTSQGMTLMSPVAQYACGRLAGLSPMALMPFSLTKTESFNPLSSARSSKVLLGMEVLGGTLPSQAST